MNLKQVRAACDRLVQFHSEELGQLRRDLNAAVVCVGNTWEPEFGAPTNMPGMMYCTSVRGVLITRRMRRDTEVPPDGRGVLTTNMGAGMSALIGDGHGMDMRVRRDQGNFVVVRERTPEESAARRSASPEVAVDDAASVGKQLSFHGGVFENLERHLVVDPDQNIEFRWFVMWSTDPQRSQVASAYLAAVHGIDDSQPVLYAKSPLPVLIGAGGSSTSTPQIDTAADDNFDDILDQHDDESTGES